MKIKNALNEWEETTIERVIEDEFYDIDLSDIEDDVNYVVDNYISGTEEEISELKEKLIERSYNQKEHQTKEELKCFADRNSILYWLDDVLDYSEIYMLSSSEVLEEIVKNYNKI